MNRIIRIKSESNFTIVPNIVFKSELSLRAIGLLTYILHLPSDWILYKTHLYSTMPKDGRDAIKTAWKELEAAGYLKTVKKSSENGNLPETSYFIYDSPQIMGDFQATENPQAETRPAESKQPETRPLLNTDKLSTNKPSTKKQSTKKEQPPAGAGSPINPVKDPEVEKQRSAYQKFIDIYDKWFKERTDGVPPKYDGENCKAAKLIIAYLKTIVTNKQPGMSEDETRAKILEGWGMVLNNWHKLDNFTQQKTKLSEINSQIQNIINTIKNGNGKTKQPTGGDVSAASLASKINAAYTADGRR